MTTYGCKHKKMTGTHQIANKGYLCITFLREGRVFVKENFCFLCLVLFLVMRINFFLIILKQKPTLQSAALYKSALHMVVLNKL